MSNLVKFTTKVLKKSQFLIIFPPKNALLWPKWVVKFNFFFRPNPPFAEKIQKHPLPEVKISEKTPPRGDNFGKKRTPEVKFSEKNAPWWPKFELGPSIPHSLQPCCIAGIFLYFISLFHTFSLWHPPQGLGRLHKPYQTPNPDISCF